jgi:SNF2 family DNA or RNA helicase
LLSHQSILLKWLEAQHSVPASSSSSSSASLSANTQLHTNNLLVDDGIELTTPVLVTYLDHFYRERVRPHSPTLLVVAPQQVTSFQHAFTANSALHIVTYYGSVESRKLAIALEFPPPTPPPVSPSSASTSTSASTISSLTRNAINSSTEPEFSFQVLITTPALLIKHVARFREFQWAHLIVDDATALKTSGSQLQEMMKNINRQRTILALHTQLRDFSELWQLLSISSSGSFPDKQLFLEQHARELATTTRTTTAGSELAPLSHFATRMTADWVGTAAICSFAQELVVPLEFEPAQQEYTNLLMQKHGATISQASVLRSKRDTLDALTELRQCAVHPWLVRDTMSTDLRYCKATSYSAIRTRMISCSGSIHCASLLILVQLSCNSWTSCFHNCCRVLKMCLS